jgi:AcrR family transcriptional regulator
MFVAMQTVTTARRSELVASLVDLFLEDGFAQFTLGDLAERLRCSKSTLYAVGYSKEQLTVNIVVEFFRAATDAVEATTAAAGPEPSDRLVAYLRGVAQALRPASATFMRDLAAHPATATVYERNTQAAATRVRDLISEGVSSGAFRAVHGQFVATVVAETMHQIQTGAIHDLTGLHDADAYDQLADLVLNGVRS